MYEDAYRIHARGKIWKTEVSKIPGEEYERIMTSPIFPYR